jgi:hypothetical protein
VALEEQVLGQVREPREALGILGRADRVADVDLDDITRRIGNREDAHAVPELQVLPGQVELEIPHDLGSLASPEDR